nr:hypothetical protein [Klebsiella variicola]
MDLTIPMFVLAYLIAGIGFAKIWSEAASCGDVELKIIGCIFWPIGL